MISLIERIEAMEMGIKKALRQQAKQGLTT
jgi:hypothetical protein